MIECVFTLDYELYGNGDGTLRELVYEPANQLRRVFLEHGVRFVNFVEVAELEMIEQAASDPSIDLVKQQVRELHASGFETGLHLHPQWYNARYESGQWELDYSEYNLCTLAEDRISQIVDRSVRYLRRLLAEPRFTPLSFRAGNWLFQPSRVAARVLADRGFRIDSSVFKGGLQQCHGLDYRPALSNGDYWSFDHDVNYPSDNGTMLELPIHARMEPFWRLLTNKRLAVHNRPTRTGSHAQWRWCRLRDFCRLRYPRKLDFCRMTLAEMISTIDAAARLDQQRSGVLRPVVAIGHTKDLVDIDTVDAFLSYLAMRKIPVTTFADLYPRLHAQAIN